MSEMLIRQWIGDDFLKKAKRDLRVDAKNFISEMFIFHLKSAKIVANKGFADCLKNSLTTLFHLNYVGYKGKGYLTTEYDFTFIFTI